MENSNASWLFAIAGVVVLALLGGMYIGTMGNSKPEPQETVTPMQQPQVQPTYLNADANLIVVDQPLPGATLANSFTVSGRARGNWYFEANFPITVESATGTTLVQVPVSAQGEWMTEEFVPFTVQVTLPESYKGSAKLILHNDNASGLPEHDRSVSMPITIQ